jgi:5-methylcytosine-specific restriction endonuclease McrA
MGKHVHKLTEIDTDSRTAICENCGPVKIKHRGLHKSGKIRWGCVLLYPKRPYRIGMKTSCEFCGFKAIHQCQLDVDHIDGNHKNDDPDNLQTLCANCHRLKTFLHRDWEN